MIVIALGRALYQHGRRDSAIPPICGRLWRMARDFHNLFKLWAMGQLPAARKRPHQNTQPKPASVGPKPPPPLGFAWLVNILPEATDYRAQVQALLAEPTIMAFLAEAPQAGKMLRPLCRLLGLHPPKTALPESPPSETAPLDITPQETPTAPIAPHQEQAEAADTRTTPPEILP